MVVVSLRNQRELLACAVRAPAAGAHLPGVRRPIGARPAGARKRDSGSARLASGVALVFGRRKSTENEKAEESLGQQGARFSRKMSAGPESTHVSSSLGKGDGLHQQGKTTSLLSDVNCCCSGTMQVWWLET